MAMRQIVVDIYEFLNDVYLELCIKSCRKKFMQFLLLHRSLKHAISRLGKSSGVGTGTTTEALRIGTSA